MWEHHRGQSFKVTRCFALILLLQTFLYIYAVPAYRQYIVHALPLLAVLSALIARSTHAVLTELYPPWKKMSAMVLGLLPAVLLVTYSLKKILKNKTLFNASSRYTLIQDAVGDIQSVISPGSRVVAGVDKIFLFPESIVRSPLVFMQFKQPPIPQYIKDEQKNDGIVYHKPAQDDAVRLKFDLLARTHFNNFFQNYFVTEYYREMNCAQLVAQFSYPIRHPPPSNGTIKTKFLRIYKTNYNEWPFKNLPVGKTLTPELLDPLFILRQKEFLAKGQIPETRIEEPFLVVNAGPDQFLKIQPDQIKAEVVLDGSQSFSQKEPIMNYLWERSLEHVQKQNLEKVAEGVNPTILLPPGRHVLQLVVQDSEGRCSRDTLFVNIKQDFSDFVNLALKSNGALATANMSNSGLDPNNAINGKKGGAFKDSWASAQSKDAWWQVDLGERSYKIHFLVIHFRDDFKAGNQTNHFEILASNDPEFKSYEKIASREEGGFPQSGFWKAKVDSSEKFRYVRLIKTSNSYTSFSEFEVYAEK